MPKHFRRFLILAVLSSCNLIGDSTFENINDGGDSVKGDVAHGLMDLGMSNDTSTDLGPECKDGYGCESGFCEAGQCMDAKCFDGLKNGKETDLDCGGSCAPCTTGMVCAENADCDGGACTNKVCKPASCVDELKNGNESDFDCGGDCLPCATGAICAGNLDCDSTNCKDEICVASQCGDNIVNGTDECDEGAVNTLTCNGDCTTARCGDGLLNTVANEICDDGNVITEVCVYGQRACSICDDECTTQAGATRFCGDGHVDLTEVCDDGKNDGSPGSCLADCSAPVICGDGAVTGTEGCDDGNTNTEDCSYGAMSCTVCDATCVSVAGATSYCGDGVTDIGNNEECDDGNLVEIDMCKNNCQSAFKRVFVTSQTTQGNFGGLAGGDAYCQTFADAAGLGGTYMAWLSDSTGSPSTRFTRSTISYRLVDGTLIADNWADLITGSLENPINLTEVGLTPPDSSSVCGYQTTVWSNTYNNGTVHNAITDCEDWTGVGGASWGKWTEIDSKWSRACNGGICTSSSNLYCFEQ